MSEPRYRRRATDIDGAVRWDGCAHTANAFVGDRYGIDWEYCAQDSTQLLLPIMQGSVYAKVGDWLVRRGTKVWVVEAEDFDELYEAVT